MWLRTGASSAQTGLVSWAQLTDMRPVEVRLGKWQQSTGSTWTVVNQVPRQVLLDAGAKMVGKAQLNQLVHPLQSLLYPPFFTHICVNTRASPSYVFQAGRLRSFHEITFVRDQIMQGAARCRRTTSAAATSATAHQSTLPAPTGHRAARPQDLLCAISPE